MSCAGNTGEKSLAPVDVYIIEMVEAHKVIDGGQMIWLSAGFCKIDQYLCSCGFSGNLVEMDKHQRIVWGIPDPWEELREAIDNLRVAIIDTIPKMNAFSEAWRRRNGTENSENNARPE